jgi:hypothetical protein
MRTLTELHERHLSGVMAALLPFSIGKLFSASAFVFTSAAEDLARAAKIAGGLSGLLLCVTAITFLVQQTRLNLSLKGPRDLDRRGRWHDDGFVFMTLGKASFIAVSFTAMTLFFLEKVARGLDLPPVFFLQAALFVCGASFSLAFFGINFWPTRLAEHAPPDGSGSTAD